MEYLKISDFAEKAGVTPQGIYKRLNSDLQPYLIVEDGIKLLHVDALNLFTVKQPSKDAQRIQELESLVTQLQNEKISLMQQLAENSQKLANIVTKHAQQVENFQLLLAQNQQLQQSLIQLPSTVDMVENRLIQLETTVNKPRRFGLFSRKKTVE